MEIKSGGISIGMIDLILLMIAWFTYKSINMVLGFALLMFILDLLFLLAVIPILGNIGYFILGKKAMVWVIGLTGLAESWLIQFIFWLNFWVGILISLLILLAIILSKRR